MPWQPDPLRDFEDMGEHFMQVWHKELKALNGVYKVISGEEDRLQNAINAVNKFLLSLQSA